MIGMVGFLINKIFGVNWCQLTRPPPAVSPFKTHFTIIFRKFYRNNKAVRIENDDHVISRRSRSVLQYNIRHKKCHVITAHYTGWGQHTTCAPSSLLPVPHQIQKSVKICTYQKKRVSHNFIELVGG